MKHKGNGRWLWSAIFVVTLGIFLLSLPYEGTFTQVTEFIMLTISGMIFAEGFATLPNHPTPYFGVVTKWGNRSWKKRNGSFITVYKSEGLSWLFLRWIKYSVVPVIAAKQETDADPEVVTTPDGVTTKIPASYAYTVDKENAVNFLNLASKPGESPFKVFENSFSDILQQKIRTWARSNMSNFQTWEDLQNSKEDAIKDLIESILGEDVSNEDLKKIRDGDGKWRLKQFGVILNRINLKEMISFGPVYDEALKKKIELQQKKTETTDFETDIELAKIMLNEYTKVGITKTLDECLKFITERKIRTEANKSQSLSSLANTVLNAKTSKS